MLEKIRRLKAKLRKAGFVERPAKGSHTYWFDPSNPSNYLLIAGHDGDDSSKAQRHDVEDALRKAKEQHG